MSDILKAAKQALEGVTPGPWATHIVDETSVVSGDGIEVATTCDSSKVERADAYNNEYERMEADARFIAASRELVPALITAIEQAEAEAAALRNEVARLREALKYGCSAAINSLHNESGDLPEWNEGSGIWVMLSALGCHREHRLNETVRAALAAFKETTHA